MKDKKKGFLALLATSITFGSFGLWIRLLSHSLTTYQQIVFRNIFALIFTVLIIIFRKIDWKELFEVNKFKLLLFTLLVPLSVILYVFAIIYEKISVVTFTFYAGTIIMSWLLGMIIFKEKPTKLEWLSLLLVFVGLVVINQPISLNSISFGLILALLSGLAESIGHALRKSFGKEINKFLLVLFTAIGGVFVSGIMIKMSGDSLLFLDNLPTETWIVGILFGGFLVLVNFLLLFGFNNFDISLGSIVLSAELIFATLFGAIFLKEYPSMIELLGGLFILIAIIIPNLPAVIKRTKSDG